MTHDPESKSMKVLLLLYELGQSGIADLLHNYEKRYPNDYMHNKLMIVTLDVHNRIGRVRKKYPRRVRVFWGTHSQMYEVTPKGIKTLRDMQLI